MVNPNHDSLYVRLTQLESLLRDAQEALPVQAFESLLKLQDAKLLLGLIRAEVLE